MIKLIPISLLTLCLGSQAWAETKPVDAKNPAAEVGGGGRLNPDLKTDRRAIGEFLDWRFGMFIHWGPVTLKGTEIGWSRGKQVPVEKYDSLYKQFNPEKFDADAWAKAAADAGMKYLVITAKHHDGFCLWPSDFTDYDIAATPWKKGKGDVLKDLAEACTRHGVRFCTYYTVCDWHHPDWLPRFQDPRPATGADPARFDRYMRDQLGEIINRYDPALIWFDGNWFKEWSQERGQKLYADLRRMKPHLLINNRVDTAAFGAGNHKVLSPGFAGDYATPEQFIGPYAAYPWETCALITTQQWAWKPNDPLKSYKETMDHVFRCAGGNGNLLLNIGPRADGTIEPAQVARLHEIGEWMKKYGESIYGTRGGPWLPVHDKVSTFRGNTAYVHLLAGQGEVFLPTEGFSIRSAQLLTGGESTLTSEEDGVRIRIPEAARNPLNIVIKLELDRPVKELPVRSFVPRWTAQATASNTFQNDPTYGPDKAVDGDSQTRWATDAGLKSATLEASLPAPRVVKGALIDEAMGNRVAKWRLSARVAGQWKQVTEGTTIGAGHDVRFNPVKAEALRLELLEASDGPTLNEFRPVF
jgi:alpha-L-fucosidase